MGIKFAPARANALRQPETDPALYPANALVTTYGSDFGLSLH